MDAANISIWLGKPPVAPKPTEVVKPGELSDEEQADTEERSVVEEEEDEDIAEDTRKPNSMPQDEGPEESSSSSLSGGPDQDSSTSSYAGFYIDIPHIPDKDDYESLPGHFEVLRIVRQVSEDRFLVKLKSDERDLIGSRQLRQLTNGPVALRAYHSQKMASPRRRNAKRSQEHGMVNWTSLDLSDPDDYDAPSHKRKGRSTGTRVSGIATDSEAEPKSSTEEEDSVSELSHPNGRRSLRLSTNRSRHSLNDENTAADSENSDLPRSRRLRNTKVQQSACRSSRSKRGRRSRPLESDEEVFPDARRSERNRALPRRSMRERHEDEISAHSEEEVGPKVVAAKETFARPPDHEEFRRHHRPDCDTCAFKGDSDRKGPLVYCQGCTNSYHKLCLGNRGTREHLATKVAENHFVLQCRRCIGVAQRKDRTAPNQGVCTTCKESGALSKPFRSRLTTRQEQMQREENGGRDPITIVDRSMLGVVNNLLFRCALCQRAWHMHHLPKRNTASSQHEDVDEDELGEQEIAQHRYEAYHRAWRCKDCIEQQIQADVLVAWRPIDLGKYIPGCTVDMIEESEKEYLVKWRSQSYFRTTWMPGDWVWSTTSPAMRIAFMRREENQSPKMTTEDAIPEDFFRVDIVFDIRYSSVVRNRTKEIDLARVKEVDSAYVKYKGLGYEDAIWEKPPNIEETERWNDFKAAYEEWVMKHYVSIPPQSSLRRHLSTIRSQNDFEASMMKKTQPANVTGGEMMQYQLEGMNWLYYQWFKGQNAILADEMGLGKTIQLIAFFAILIQEHKSWPFLVVVPNSTCSNWRREIRKWVPSLRVVTYYGSAHARKLAHDFELFPKDEEYVAKKKGVQHKKNEVKDIKAHVVVASYESIAEEKTRKSLMKVPWMGLVVDEGQRLKNDKNLVYESLSKMRFPFKVLLTGTPLQNNARELFNLLQFLDRRLDASALEQKYETLTKENVPELHELLRPFFLRRTKVQVLTFLPPMAQIILPVTMSIVQKKVYKSILAKNPHLMKSIFSRSGALASKERHNLNNILMQLRKTLCHPFVYSRDIEDRSYDAAVSHRNLVEASSKLQLLQIMLPKLQDRGHRVLIFSQFLDNLDIIQDFLDGLGLLYQRLDGQINSLEKQKRIDTFNAPDSPYFAFLLSTRAGGVGINLATADTVLIMDPDFNPHQDIQALSRAHRIGQKNKVLVFQMMTRGSAEEKILHMGKKKLALDHVLIQQMGQEDDAGESLESILRHGAQALFDDDETGDIHYDSASVDRLLDRSQIENTNTGEDKSAESQFSFARIWANDKGALVEEGLDDTEPSIPNPTVWDKILKERERQYAEEAALKAETLGRGKRKRQNVDYATQATMDQDHLASPFKGRANGDASDTDFLARDAESDGEETPADETDLTSAETGSITARPKPSAPTQPTIKAKPFKRVKVPSGAAPHFNGDGPADYVPLGGLLPTHLCSACDEIHPMGWCRLKLAGVEHCGLCGLAHTGHGRTCPHLHSEVQVATLLGTLKESTEGNELTEQATKYLRAIRGDLVQRKRAQEKKVVDGHVPGQEQGLVNIMPRPAVGVGNIDVHGAAADHQPVRPIGVVADGVLVQQQAIQARLRQELNGGRPWSQILTPR